MEQQLKSLIESKDLDGLRKLLVANPGLSNEGIAIPFDAKCQTKAHPLHRICDAVFTHNISDDEAIEIAKIFLASGADINGDQLKGKDTPLLAAASLHAEKLGIFYIERGADIHFAGRSDGATALHWAAYCGLDKLAKKLIDQNAKIDERDTRYDCTPLAWAIEPLLSPDKSNGRGQVACIKLLLKAEADENKLQPAALRFLNELENNGWELK